MADATFLGMTRLENLKIYRYSHTSIGAGATVSNIGIDIPRKGAIRGFKIVCPNSLEYDFTIYQKTGEYVLSPNVAIAVGGILTGLYSELFNTPIPYFNNDTTIASKLYLQIVNLDLVNATGAVNFEITIEHEAYVQVER